MQPNKTNVFVDLQAVSSDTAGVPKVAKELLASLSIYDKKHSYYLSLTKDSSKYLSIQHSHFQQHIWTNKFLFPGIRIISQLFFDHLRVNKIQPDIYFAPATLLPFNLSNKIIKITLIHDLAPFVLKNIYTPFRQAYHRFLIKSVSKRADQIVTISESTKNDIIKYLNISQEKIVVIPNAIQTEIYYRNIIEINFHRKRLKLPNNYILFVGKIQPRKNLKRLIIAFNKVLANNKIDLYLIIVGGKGWLAQDIIKEFNESPYKDNIIFPGHVGDNDLQWYYRCANIFCYLSLYEGFGLPILEAMSNSIPVITSDIGAMKEVSGNAAILCDPYNIDSISTSILQLLNNTSLCQTLINNGYERLNHYTWEKSALQYIKIWEKYVAK